MVIKFPIRYNTVAFMADANDIFKKFLFELINKLLQKCCIKKENMSLILP